MPNDWNLSISHIFGPRIIVVVIMPLGEIPEMSFELLRFSIWASNNELILTYLEEET